MDPHKFFDNQLHTADQLHEIIQRNTTPPDRPRDMAKDIAYLAEYIKNLQNHIEFLMDDYAETVKRIDSLSEKK